MEGLGLVKNAAVWESAGDKDIVTKLAVDEQINNKIGTGDLKIYVKDPSFEGDPACTFNANSDTDVKFNIDTASKANEVDYTTQTCQDEDTWHTLAVEHDDQCHIDQRRTGFVLQDDEQDWQ